MTPPPDHLPDDPRELVGEPLWDCLGEARIPPVPDDFDQRFRATLRTETPWYRRRIVPIGAGVAAFSAAAAGLFIVLSPDVAPVDPVPLPSDDLALVADLEIVENLALLEDLELMMAWDGAAP